MLAKTLLRLMAVAGGAIAVQVNEDLVTWTKSGLRYRALLITLPSSPVVTEVQTATATATVRLRSVSTPFKRSVKRAFLNQWSYSGCVDDDEHLPPLVSPFPYQVSSDEVSGAACMHFCDERGNTFAATQNGNECWCGDKLSEVNITLVDKSRCDAACTGAPDEMCGGNSGLTVYTRST